MTTIKPIGPTTPQLHVFVPLCHRAIFVSMPDYLRVTDSIEFDFICYWQILGQSSESNQPTAVFAKYSHKLVSSTLNPPSPSIHPTDVE